MSATAQMLDGVLQQGMTTENAKKATAESASSSQMDKDSFLQLLVAQMKYQDPLEPTSNTEYISQYATFSELEQMQNMSSTLDLQRATSLIGQTIVVEKTDENGKISQDMGIVDYVKYESGEAKLWVNGTSYALDEVKEVADAEYIDAYSKAVQLIKKMNELPTAVNLTLEDKEAVEAIKESYDSLNDYQKSFLGTDFEKNLTSYVDKIKELELLDENSSAE